MDIEKKWADSIHTRFYPAFASVEYIKKPSNTRIQIEFEVNSTPPLQMLRAMFQDLSIDEIQLFIEEAKIQGKSSVIIFATCECFLICDAEGNCHRECFICYPPPAAKCCCPGMCP